MNTFIKAVAGVLEVEKLDLDDEFRALPSWCSLQAFGLLVLMENDWNAPITIEQLQGMKTVRDLYREAFLVFAAGILKVKRKNIDENTKYGSIAEWDSVNHLRLVMETEKKFGVNFSMEMVTALTTMGKFLI